MNLAGRGKTLSIDVGTISLGRLTAFGLSLIIPLILTRVLSTDDYGIYRELSLLIVTLQPILMFGIPSSLRYLIPRADTMEKRRFIIQAVTISMAIGTGLFVFLALAGGALTDILYHENFSEYMLVLGAHGFFLITASYIGVIMIVNDDVNLASITAMAFSILDIILMCGGVIIFQTVIGLLISIAIASLIKFFVALIYIAKYVKPKISYISYPSMKYQLSFSAPLGLTDVINVLNINLDKFFIAYFFTQGTFGVYSIGALITPMILVIYRSVFDIIVPEFSKLYKAGKVSALIRLWHEGVRKLALFFYPLFIFLIFYASDLIAILFPDAYSGSVPVFRLYLFLLPLTITLFNGVLLAAGETKYLLKATSVAFVANIILNYLMIQWFIDMGIGLLGPPTATIIVNIILRALMLNHVKTITKRPIAKLFPWTLLGKIMALSIISGLISIIIMFILGFEPLGDLISFPVSFTGLLNMLNSLPEILTNIISFALGFGAFFTIYYVFARKAGLIKDEDIYVLKSFLKLKA